ncbi:FHA domain-containing protein [Diaminobutyricimonas aerilata]|uniref:FHA domain-containing protein n=1 Tax=Diaminobutyricimonas aerilata TaxID=1162967 RepID=A0A2M9CID5_9MICO|nr:FHA domain-containing protein [Diaminobutyricimonas aerilata]PJJ71671.1 FHA domain-containing protein [Diaminobutyricimonas aerilata]
MVLQYSPSDPAAWRAIVTDTALLVLDPAADGALLPDLAGRLEQEGAFQAVLDRLVAGGVSTAPSFALLSWGGGESLGDLRVLVRGAVALTITSAQGDSRLSGEGVTTWSEQFVPGTTGVTVSTPGGDWALGGASTPAPTAVATSAPSAAPEPRTAPAASEPTPVAATPQPKATAAAPEPTPAAAAPAPPAFPTPVPAEAPQPTARPATAPTPVVEPGELDSEATMVPSAIPDADGDHDGHTVMSSDIRAMRAGRPRASDTASPAAPKDVAFSLELPTGRREPLSSAVVVGRAPSAGRSTGADAPRLVTLGGDDQDISRTHARVAVEGGTVVVTDLHSRNGTMVVLPGKGPQRLRAGEPTAVITGTVIDLGSGVTLTVREG